jgi:hypothetical protein
MRLSAHADEKHMLTDVSCVPRPIQPSLASGALPASNLEKRRLINRSMEVITRFMIGSRSFSRECVSIHRTLHFAIERNAGFDL